MARETRCAMKRQQKRPDGVGATGCGQGRGEHKLTESFGAVVMAVYGDGFAGGRGEQNEELTTEPGVRSERVEEAPECRTMARQCRDGGAAPRGGGVRSREPGGVRL